MSTPPQNTQKTALITGAARRIGRSIALALASKGWDIAVHYRGSDRDASKLVEEIVGLGLRAIKLQCDLSQPDAVENLIPMCCRELSPPTCLINNASAFQPDHVPDLTPQRWDEHLAINLTSPVFLTQALVKHLPDAMSANVINIIDQRVWRLTPDFFSYTISKAGLWTATKTLAQALAPKVRVNAVGPGPVLKSIHQSDAEFAAEVRSTLLKQAPTPEDIARAVVFILDTPAMTGQMIALDSGQHLAWTNEPQS